MDEDVKFFKSQYTGEQIEDAIGQVRSGKLLTEENGNEKYLKLDGGGSVKGSISVSSQTDADKVVSELTNTGLKKANEDVRIGFGQLEDHAIVHTSKADMELQGGTIHISRENLSFASKNDIKFADDSAEKKPILKNIGDPVDPSDAVTKQYLEKHGGGDPMTNEEIDEIMSSLM